MSPRSASYALPALALFALACGAPETEPNLAMGFPADYLYSFRPLPENYATKERPIDAQRVALGQKLFFETRLSASGELSCNSCHDLADFGDDGLSVSVGHEGRKGTRNAPTVYNAAGYLTQFWDGRSPDIEDQARHPILNPVEMAAASEDSVVAVLRSDPAYQEQFQQVFPDSAEPLTYDNMVIAIGAFERTLVTPSRFDDYLRGDHSALSEIEKTGFRRFIEVGCAGCHNGPELGGHTFEKMGHLIDYPVQTDLGRHQVTNKDEDRMKFRVPGLRNVAETAPYFHDGSIATLGDAVALMAKHQLAKPLSHEDHRSIVAFLRALTGTLPAHLVKAAEALKPTPAPPPAEETPEETPEAPVETPATEEAAP